MMISGEGIGGKAGRRVEMGGSERVRDMARVLKTMQWNG